MTMMVTGTRLLLANADTLHCPQFANAGKEIAKVTM